MQTPITLPDSVDELKTLLLAQLASTASLQTERDAFLHERETFRIELDTVLAESDSFKQSSESRDQEITRLKLLIEKHAAHALWQKVREVDAPNRSVGIRTRRTLHRPRSKPA